MYKINGTTITLTKGDSFYCQLSLMKNGQAFTPSEGDVIKFGMKKEFWDTEPLIEKIIPNDTLVLSILPSDTESLQPATYCYDIEYTSLGGDVDTFINNQQFNLVPEVI